MRDKMLERSGEGWELVSAIMSPEDADRYDLFWKRPQGVSNERPLGLTGWDHVEARFNQANAIGWPGGLDGKVRECLERYIRNRLREPAISQVQHMRVRLVDGSPLWVCLGQMLAALEGITPPTA